MKTASQKIIASLLVAAFIGGISACHTVKGVGQDTKRAGEIIEKEADQHIDKK